MRFCSKDNDVFEWLFSRDHYFSGCLPIECLKLWMESKVFAKRIKQWKWAQLYAIQLCKYMLLKLCLRRFNIVLGDRSQKTAWVFRARTFSGAFTTSSSSSVPCTIFTWIKSKVYSIKLCPVQVTAAITVGSTQNKFTDLDHLSREQIIFFMSLVNDPFITVKFSQ